MDINQLVMKMQNNIAILENSLTVIKVNHMLIIQTHNLTTRYLATMKTYVFTGPQSPTFT